MSGPRLVACVLALFAVALLVPAARADEKVVDGCKVVKVEDSRLFLTDAKGGMHSADVASDAKITVGGRDVKLADLKAGQTVKLTLKKEEGSPITIVKIEGRSS
jgi:hypothetical protein